ncbi:MAG: hypothetical protein ACR2NV_02185 [Thermoleophilaceae bacterium]
MEVLPHWPEGAAGVLCAAGPHPIPVSTSVRAGDHRFLFALGPKRDALRRLREDPLAAFCLLAEGLAFTAHGEVHVLREEMEDVPIAALEFRVEDVQDHLADGRTRMLAAPGWEWREERAAEADRAVRAELGRLARSLRA